MTPYWIVTLTVWLGVMAYATPGAWRAAIRQSQKRGDPMRLAEWLIALFINANVARWLIVPDNQDVWKAIYIVGILTGIYTIRLMCAYGPGPIVGGDDD